MKRILLGLTVGV
jgi:hypothetical protein